MNRDEAREKLNATIQAEVVNALNFFSTNGSLTDLQEVLALVRHESAPVKTAAIKSSCLLIRRNLVAHFNDLEPDVRAKLGTILESLDPRIVTELSTDLYCDDEQRRLRTVQILGLLRKNPTLQDVLADLVKDRDVKIRATAVALLGKVIDVKDQQLIFGLLNDKDLRVRANTVEAIESLGNPRLVHVLLRYRKASNNRIRGNVIKALHTLGYGELEPDLLQMLRSGEDRMTATGLWVISRIRLTTPKLIDEVAAHLLSEEEMVGRNAVAALEAMDHPRATGFLRYLGPEALSAGEREENGQKAPDGGEGTGESDRESRPADLRGGS